MCYFKCVAPRPSDGGAFAPPIQCAALKYGIILILNLKLAHDINQNLKSAINTSVRWGPKGLRGHLCPLVVLVFATPQLIEV